MISQLLIAFIVGSVIEILLIIYGKVKIQTIMVIVILGAILLIILYAYDYLFMSMYDCDGGILVGILIAYSTLALGLVGLFFYYIIHILKKFLNRN